MTCFLIRFRYEYYCQGYEWIWEYCLVYAIDFNDACEKISCEFYKAELFKNLTIM